MVSAQIYLVCAVSFVYRLVLCALTAMLLKPSLCLAGWAFVKMDAS